MALLLGCGGISLAVTPFPEQFSASRLPVRQPAQAADAADLPDQLLYAVSTRLDRIGRIIVPVTINGRGPFRFMLDTGASGTALADSAQARLGPLPDAGAPISVLGVSGSAVLAAVHVDRLDAGEMHFRDLDLPVLAGPVLAGIDGILGMDSVDGMRMSADFVHNKVTIVESHGRRASSQYGVVRVEFLSKRVLMSEAYVGGVRVKTIFDTGGPRTVGNPALLAALRRYRAKDEPLLETQVTDVTQTSQPGKVVRVPTVQLGAASINDLYVTFGDFDIFKIWGLDDQPALLIGMDALGTLAELTIDYRRKELQMLPRDPVAAVHLQFAREAPAR